MKAENNEVEFEMDDLIIRDSLNEKAHLNIALIIVSIVIIVFSFTYMIYEPVISNHEKSYPFQPTH